MTAPRTPRRVIRVPLRFFGARIGVVTVDVGALAGMVAQPHGFAAPLSPAANKFAVGRLRHVISRRAFDAVLESEWFEADADAGRDAMLPHHRDRDRIAHALSALEGPWGKDPDNSAARAEERGPDTEPWPALALVWVRRAIADVLHFGTGQQRTRLRALFKAKQGPPRLIRGGAAVGAEIETYYRRALREALRRPKNRRADYLAKHFPAVATLLEKASLKIDDFPSDELAALLVERDTGYEAESLARARRKPAKVRKPRRIK